MRHCWLHSIRLISFACSPFGGYKNSLQPFLYEWRGFPFLPFFSDLLSNQQGVCVVCVSVCVCVGVWANKTCSVLATSVSFHFTHNMRRWRRCLAAFFIIVTQTLFGNNASPFSPIFRNFSALFPRLPLWYPLCMHLRLFEHNNFCLLPTKSGSEWKRNYYGNSTGDSWLSLTEKEVAEKMVKYLSVLDCWWCAF